MILTEALTKKFDRFLAVDRVNLKVGEGSVLALLGPNGAGKTTTVRMLTSVLRPTSGRANVAGFDVINQPKQVRSSVGVLTEQHGLYDRMPAESYLRFFGEIYGLEPAVCRKRISDLLDMFSLSDSRDRRIGEFSKGMRQKLALTRALLHDPPVLLLDEPTSAMDPESARIVRDAILSLKSLRRTLLICTHNLSEAEELADQIAIIRNGRITACGTQEALKNRFLGTPEYEVRLAQPLNGQPLELPPDVCLIDQGFDWLKVSTPNPESSNPALILSLFRQGFPIISLRESPRSLEQVYISVMNTTVPHSVQHEQ
jgi:ABC-2 type transport system ATP-binding protein